MVDQGTHSANTTAATPATDAWRLHRRDGGPMDRAVNESLFVLANGTLGVRAGSEEGSSPTQACFLVGVWERSPIHYHERFTGFAAHTDTRLPVADASRIRLWLGNER
ncbi:MAG: beta-phosphoglucomutase, partial [Rhodanobacter sp.]